MYTVDNLTISCIDWRSRAQVADWIKQNLNGQSGLVAMAGASKAILDDGTQTAVLKQIDIALRLHQIKSVHIMDHIDCGAYGGSGKFDQKQAEVSMHRDQLEAAKRKVAEHFPDLSVKVHLIDSGGTL
ncbi:hypothetical protein KY386_00735 [Candidatus Parcubacteria bacterium]|nr:hypothetical protein [Candidatus Parcubacteria bacterium]